MQTRLRVAEEILRLNRGIELETLGIPILLVGIPEDKRPRLLRIVFLDKIDVVLEMCREFERGGVVVARLGDDEYPVFALELTQIVAHAVVVDTQHIGVEPHFASSQRGHALLLESYLLDLVFGQQIATAAATFDCKLRQVLEHLHVLELETRVELNAYHFCLAVGVGGEVHDFAAGLARSQVILLVTCETRGCEALHVVRTRLAFAIDHVVDGALVVLLEDGYMQNIGADEHLLLHAYDLVFAVAVEDDDVVEVGAVEQIRVFA